MQGITPDDYSTILQQQPSNLEYKIIDDTGHTTISNGMFAISVGEEICEDKPKVIIHANEITFNVATNIRYFVSKDTGMQDN